MFTSGILGCLFDNILPGKYHKQGPWVYRPSDPMVRGCPGSGVGSHLSLGSKADRGIISWREEPEDDGSLDEMVNDVYGAPFVRGQGSIVPEIPEF